MKRFKLFGILFMTMLFAAGCGSKEASPTGSSTDTGQNNTASAEESGSTGQKDSGAKQDADLVEDQEDSAGQKDTGEEEKTEKKTVKIYYIDDESGEMKTKEASVGSDQEIWQELQKTGIITAECELLKFEWNEAESRIELDFNSALGDRVRSMGTTGKLEIIGCVVNTYLDAYNAEGIHLTEEGKSFDAGDGSNYDGYTGKIEL